VHDSIGLLGAIISLAFLTYVLMHMMLDYNAEDSKFDRFYQTIYQDTDIKVDYSDLTICLFWHLRLLLLIVERVYDVYQYSCHRVNWDTYPLQKYWKKSEAEKHSKWSILLWTGKRVDYESILKFEKKNLRNNLKELKILKKQKDRAHVGKKIQLKQDEYHDMVFNLVEYERQIRTLKTFNVWLMSLFNIDEIWRDFRMSGYWNTYRMMGSNMHKTLLCFVFALTLAWVVNWYEESFAVFTKISAIECDSYKDHYYVSNITDDQVLCVQIIHRSVVSLLTAVLVGIAGFYITYAQLLKIIVRNWLRFKVVRTVWEASSLSSTEYFSQEHEQQTTDRGECFWEEHFKETSYPEVELLEKKEGENTQCDSLPTQAKAWTCDFRNEYENKRSDSKTTQSNGETFVQVGKKSKRGTRVCGFAMDRRAIVDDVFLIVAKPDDYKAFEDLVEYVEDETKVYRNKKKLESRICPCRAQAQSNSFNKLKKNIIDKIKNNTNETKGLIMIVNLTRRVRNIIMQGTTIFTLSPTAGEHLMLIAKGSWSGGAFLPSDENHRAILNAAIQHYDISFSMEENISKKEIPMEEEQLGKASTMEKKLMIERTHEFRVGFKKNRIWQINKGLEFVCNRRSFVDV